MITIKAAWHKQGYTGEDHLLPDADTHFEDLIGRQFRSVGEARKACDRLNTTRSERMAPIGMLVLFADGMTREV